MDLGLLQIKEILDSPEFDLMSALRSHRAALQEKIGQLQNLIQTVDNTMMHLIGEVKMSNKRLFAAFDDKKQQQYMEEAERTYGKETVQRSYQLWNRYSAQEKEKIGLEGEAIYRDLVDHIEQAPDSAEVQAIIARWHQHLRYFYEPTPEILRALGNRYNEHPDFIATFQAIHPALPALLDVRSYHSDLLYFANMT